MARRSFGLGAGDARVGLGLVGLQAGADVVAHVDVGDVDRDDLERRAARRAPAPARALEIESGFSSTCGVRLGRADGADDALADAGDDRLLGGAADQAGRGSSAP